MAARVDQAGRVRGDESTEMTEINVTETGRHVPPSSGDCGQGLDQSLPATVSGRSCFRWQHPEVIENANRHEPQWLTYSANGSRANRADESIGKGAGGAAKLPLPSGRLPWSPPLWRCLGAIRPGFSSAHELPLVVARGRQPIRCRSASRWSARGPVLCSGRSKPKPFKEEKHNAEGCEFRPPPVGRPPEDEKGRKKKVLDRERPSHGSP